mmetsp:Transcript_26381/g.59043  ORF Transcript_26381/g.59043 Transcript_26381/m.59043 type:complete len:212 (-) Transcript_26381:195-830(-)
MSDLGRLYYMGRGVKEDEGEAAAWYRKSAELGNAGAQCNLGVMYEQGRGVEKDMRQAVTWLRAAADQGWALAQCNLGLCYEQGRGVGKSDSDAARWYQLASDQGNADAQFSLALALLRGAGGVKHDVGKIRALLSSSALQGHVRAQKCLDVMPIAEARNAEARAKEKKGDTSREDGPGAEATGGAVQQGSGVTPGIKPKSTTKKKGKQKRK